MSNHTNENLTDPEDGSVPLSPRGGTASPGRARLRLRRPVLAVAVLSLVAAACGGASASKSASSTGSSSSGTKSSAPTGSGGGSTSGGSPGSFGGGAGGFAGGKVPGAFGTVAAVSGSTLEVQNPETGQVSVLVTASTVISRTVTVPASSVRVGSCVTVTGTPSSTGTVSARTVSIRPATAGSCAVARRGFPGGFRPGSRSGSAGTTPPSVPGGRKFSGSKLGFASGKVTATNSAGFTVQSSIGGKTKSVTVHTTSATTYSEAERGTLADVHVGACASAFGTTGDTGAVTAKTLSLSTPGPKGCVGGFGGGGFGAFGVFGGAAGGSAGAGTAGSSGQGTTSA